MTLHPTSVRRATWASAVAVAIGAALLLTAISPAGPASAQDELACDARPVVMTTADGIDFVRTPDACFTELPDWSYEPQYLSFGLVRPGEPRERLVVEVEHPPGVAEELLARGREADPAPRPVEKRDAKPLLQPLELHGHG